MEFCLWCHLENALIVKEHAILPYPEGTACAEVLLAGEEGGSSAKVVFVGMGLGAVLKFIVDGLAAFGSVITIPIKSLKTEFSAEIYPALVGVGYICGPSIAAKMFAGGVLGWLVLIPAIVLLGNETVLYPATVSIAELYEAGGAGAIWSSYIRYIGAGAVAAAGIISLIKTLPLIVRTFRDSIKSMKEGKNTSTLRTQQDLSMKFIGIGVIAMILLLWILPQIPVGLVGAIVIVVFGFFFATVSSRMVGLVGSSNNPVSGMAIATLLIATILLKITGDTGAHGMQGAIAIGSIICIIAAMAGDTSQDLKTGFLLGATPKKQQIGEVIGAIVSALAIGGVLVLLDSAWGFGSEMLAAPQATLMKMIVEGVMGGNLPWPLVFMGVFIAIVVELLGINALTVAIGLYLPLELSSTIMLGGLVRLILEKKNINEEIGEDSSQGVLFSSGLIAGEGLMGIILAILAVCGVSGKLAFINALLPNTQVDEIILLVILLILLLVYSKSKKKNEKK